MKHLATIQLEFLKSARKWKDMSLEDQKGYLSRHPKSKRKLTGKPGGSSSADDSTTNKNKKQNDVQSEASTAADFLEKLSTTPNAKTYAKQQIVELQTKIDARIESARRKEVRAQGNLDGTAFEAAHERNEPLVVEQKLLQHFLGHGTKKIPEELQEQYDSMQEQKKYHNERKQERNKELEKHDDLIGKIVSWTSQKNHGQTMSGRVIKLKVSKRGGIMASIDNGWRVPVSMLDKNVKNPPKEEAGKTLVTAKDLVNKKITWKTKFTPGYRHVRGMRGFGGIQKQEPPGWDAATGTASGKVTAARGSKVEVGGWRIPLSLIHQVDGKKFDKWK